MRHSGDSVWTMRINRVFESRDDVLLVKAARPSQRAHNVMNYIELEKWRLPGSVSIPVK